MTTDYRSVLGIDAAWTDRRPSGIALAAENESGWRLVAADSSYAEFLARPSESSSEPSVAGQPANPAKLISLCERLCGVAPAVVAVDMPLSREKICGRRVSDIGVSRAFAAKKCATHSPSVMRPGRVSDQMRADFEAAGYHLWTADRGPTPALFEVYPHPALLALTNADQRLEYKTAKTLTYWPREPLAVRKRKLFDVWMRIGAALDAEIAGVAAAIPLPAESTVGRALKAYEDRLDAIVCAWCAICALQGRAKAYGDAVSAIWIPTAERG
jgi:predicted RNase H-like nuclease